MSRKLPTAVQEVRVELIEDKIMLDSDLAEFYEVRTFKLNKFVKRNLDRFPRTSCSDSLRKRPSF
jgi:hypothetical protein